MFIKRKKCNPLIFFYFSGNIGDSECSECREKTSSYIELKAHYIKHHPQSWTHYSTEVVCNKPKALLSGNNNAFNILIWDGTGKTIINIYFNYNYYNCNVLFVTRLEL